MKRSSAELKSMARGAMIGNYGLFVGAILISGLIGFLSSYLTNFLIGPNGTTFSTILNYIINFLFSLLMQLLAAGVMKIALSISRHEPTGLKDLFFAFTHHPDRFLVIGLIFTVIQLIFVTIPADVISLAYVSSMTATSSVYELLISSYSYLGVVSLVSSLGNLLVLIITLGFSMAMFLLVDHTDISALDALKESWHMMRGNKWNYFYVTFITFIGLCILGAFSCGIAYLWIFPYMHVTKAMYYRSIKNEF